MTAPPTNAESPAFTTRVEVRAQSLFLAVLVGGALVASSQLLSINRELGALNANVATLTELAREHGNQLRDLDRRMTSLEASVKALTEAVNRLNAPKP
jgi:chromosome segregation ATPase